MCHEDPRRIFVRFCQGHFTILFCALHAPHRAHERDSITTWWNHTHALLAQHRRNDPVVLAGDMNSSVGSVPSRYVSTCAAETEDLAGELFHAALRDCECWLPCTFGDFQSGPSATYTQKRNGKPCRPDFIAIPDGWGDSGTKAWVEHGVHVAAAGIDHLATCVSVCQSFELPGFQSSKTRRRIRPQVFCDPANREQVTLALQSAPHVGWHVSAHAHAAMLVKHLQDEFLKISSHAQRRPIHVYIQEHTWALQKRVTYQKRSLARLQQHRTTALLAFCLSVWRTPAGRCEPDVDPNVTPWSGNWDLQACVSSILHLYHIRIGSKHLRKACRQDRDAYISSLADKLATCPTGEVYASLHKLLCHKRKKAYAPEPLPKVRDADGNVCPDPQAAQSRWREYFAAMEAGSCMSVQTLADTVLDDQSGVWPAPTDVQGLPNATDLIRLMLSSKANKAAGMDGLPNELLRNFAPESAQALQPLLYKLVFRGAEALGMKGGMAVWFHKGKGAKDLCESYRQILLLPCFAKILHQAVRPSMRDLFQASTPPLQIGGKPGQSVCFGAHLVRAFLRHNACLKRSCFVLFTDIATAFYAVVRQLIAARQTDSAASPALSEDICQGLGLSAEDIAQLRWHAQQPSSMRQAGASPWLEAVAERLSANTWFMLKGDTAAILTARGTRPGSSWADILFGMVISRVLQERDALEATGPSSSLSKPKVPWDGRYVLSPCSSDSGHIELGDLVWADDVATMRVCDSSDKLAYGIAVSSGSLCDASASFGFRLSFGPNKTAAIAQPSGAGARKTARNLFCPSGHNGEVKAMREHVAPIRVPLVGTYRHLGVMQSPRGALLTEIRYRSAQAWAKFAEGRRKVFTSRGISVQRKAFILRSSVLPKLLYGSGSWPGLNMRELRAFGGAIWGFYRSICSVGRSADQHLLSSTVLALTGLPSVTVTLHCQRLLYLKSLLQSGPAELWATLRTDGSYLEAMWGALGWLFSWVYATCPLPDPRVEWDPWVTFIRDSPNRFKGLILRAQGLEACRQQVLGSLDGLYRAIRNMAPSLPDNAPPAHPCMEACIPCKRLFPTRVAWAGHAARVHGYRCKAHLLAQSRLCLSCGKAFSSVARLRRHLIASAGCVRSWGSFRPAPGCLLPETPGHDQMPPYVVPGVFLDTDCATGDVPDSVSTGLLASLQALSECDDTAVWETVADFVEPLQTLRATVQHWRDLAPDCDWIQQSAANVLLLLDPELIGDPDPAQTSKACRHAFSQDLPPEWKKIPSFCIPTSDVGPCFELAPPPPVVLDPRSATSVRLKTGRAYSAWLEQACAVLAKGLAVAQAEQCSFKVLCPNFELCLGPASEWLKAAGFIFWPGGVVSSDFVSPEFNC